MNVYCLIGMYEYMIIMNDDKIRILGEGILHLPNNVPKQDSYSLLCSHMWFCPKDNHSTLPTSATQDDHSWTQRCTLFHPIGIHLPYTISAPRDDHRRQRICMSLNATGIDSTCTILATQGGSKSGCHWIPWTLICPGPFQQLKMTILGSSFACRSRPWTLIRPGPFQQLKVTIRSGTATCAFVP